MFERLQRRIGLIDIPEGELINTAPTQELEAASSEYLNLAKRAGFNGGVDLITSERAKITSAAKLSLFLAFLAENGITRYPNKSVAKYLWSIRPPDCFPYWHPMNGGARREINRDGSVSEGFWQMKQYQKPIPDAVLLTMIKLREGWKEREGREFGFYISDFHDSIMADPFLAICFENEFIVIERWDEPKFRM